MKQHRIIITAKILKLVFSFGVLSLLFWQNALAEADTGVSPLPVLKKGIYPVVNVINPQISISRSGLSAIFKMRLRKWNDGTPVTVYVLEDDNPLHKKFSKKILHVFPHQLRRAWNRAVFSGSGQAPNTVTSTAEMVEIISSTPGAIGYLSPDDITDNIKILDVQ